MIHPVPKPVKRIKQRKPLTRSKPMQRKRARRIDRKSTEEAAFLTWVHTQECCAKGIAFVIDGRTETHWCYAGMTYGPPVQAAHFRDHTGGGLKESDLTCIPLCMDLHDDYDNRRPHFFKGWPLEARKDWHRLRQAEIRALWKAFSAHFELVGEP